MLNCVDICLATNGNLFCLMECLQRQGTADLRMWDAVQLTDKLLVGMLEAAPDAVLCVDPDGRIVLVNAQTERLFGYRRQELTGQLVEILVPDAIRAGHPARRAGYVADPRPRQMGEGIELAGRRRDGSTFPAEISPNGIVWSASCISPSAWRAWASSRAGSRTISTTCSPLSPTTPRSWPRRSTASHPGRSGRLCARISSRSRRQPSAPPGSLTSCWPSPASIDGDHVASRGGLSAGDYVSLKVSDTGTGMPQEVIDRAFEPFFTTKAKGEGTGLGLATVYGIVTQLGGYVQIYSEPGLGTTFTILLPETSQPDEGPSAPSGAALGGSGETVLVAEDEAAMREVTRRILARNGYQVITVVNGLDAIEVAAAHPGDIDILVTDVVMPQMLGKEAAERIRALYPAVKVLFMSGYTQGVLDTQGILETGSYLIEKPFTERSLLAKLHEIMSVRS
jgi:PAS domain S-box-containing protein